MKLYSENEYYKLYQGSMLDMLEVIDKESIDSIITDPPYELNFMGKGWDNSGIAFQPDTWKKCFEVLKPGGYLLAFGGSRTFHRIAVAIEDAGFEIRDTIMWLYGSGFPKSMALDKSLEAKLTTGSGNKTGFKKLNGELVDRGDYGYAKMQKEQGNRPSDYNKIEEKRLGKLEATTDLAKQYQGWGTALKPSFEPIIVARKPFKGSLVDNVIEWGVGGINIDECRVEYEKTTNPATNPLYRQENADKYKQVQSGKLSNGAVSWTSGKNGVNKDGRFPANTILTYDEKDFFEVCGGFPYSSSNGGNASMPKMGSGDIGVCNYNTIGAERIDNDYFAPKDSGSASRYFYCAKASKKDRDEGLDIFEDKIECDRNEECYSANVPFNRSANPKKNIHPTVKPTELMQYLIRLVNPEGATILDCFNGSGSTGKAVMYENKEHNKNYKYIGIELTEEYLPITKARIEYVCNLEPEVDNQTNIFDFLGEQK